MPDTERLPLYSVGTWDSELDCYTPQAGVPAFNLTLNQLRASLRMLRNCGYSAHRVRSVWDGEVDWDSDSYVLVERTDGMSEAEILERWER